MANTSNTRKHTLVSGTDYADVIYNSGATVTIEAGDGNDSINNSSANVTIYGGAGNDSVYNTGSNVIVDAGLGNDSISNSLGTNVSISGGNGDDSVYNQYASEVTLDGGEGHDTIINEYGSNVSISGGAGSNYIYNKSGSDVTIKTGDGYNIINNKGSNASISSGASNDTIYNDGDSVTIESGNGIDSIKNTGKYAIIDAGDGYDRIHNSTVETYTSSKWVTVTPDNSSIAGGAGDDSIYNERGNSVKIWGDDGNDTIRNEGGAYVSVDGGAGSDKIYNTGEYALISGGKDNDSIENHGGNVTIDGGVGNDTITSDIGKTSIIGGAGNDSIKSQGSYSTLDGGDGNDRIENVDATNSYYGFNSNVSINGGDGDDTLYNGSNNSYVTITGGNGNDIVRNSSAYSTLDGGAGADSIYNDHNSASMTEIVGGSGDDYIINWGASTTIDGGDDNDTIYNSGVNVSVHSGAGSDSIDNYGASTTIDGGNDNDTIINDTRASLTAIYGGAGDDSIQNDSSQVTLDGGAGEDSITNYGDSLTIDGGAGDDYINNLYGDNILFNYAKGDGNDLIEGFNESSTLSIDEGVGTYSTIQIDSDIIVTVGDGEITLQGAADLDVVNIEGEEVVSPVWSLNGTIATYGTAKETLIVVSGVQSTIGLSLNDKVVTVETTALRQGTVTISDGYTLALGDDVAKTSTSPAVWSLSGTTATYKNASTTAGYELVDNQINYVAASGGENLFTIAGLSSTVGVSVQDKEITLTDAALSNRAAAVVTISDGYSLKLASDVDTVKESVSDWVTLSNGNVAYLANGTGSYYSVIGGNTVTYNESVAGTNKVELSGIKGNLKLGSDTVSLTADNFDGNASVVSNSGNYKFALSGDLRGKKFTTSSSNDTIINNSSNVTLDGGAGNDAITNQSGSKNVLFAYDEGEGNDSIVGFNETSTLQISNGTGTYTAETVGNDIIVTVGKGKITLVGAASLGTVHIDGMEQDSMTLILTDTNADKVTLDAGITNADASTRSKSIQITGNALDNSIVGGKVADTLSGGAGNDTLTGGWKGDLFIYTAGNDVITDYNAAAGDKVSIAGDGAKYFTHITSVDTSDNNVKLTFSNDANKTLTLKDTLNKKVIVNGATRYFDDNQIIGYDKKTVTLTSAFNGSFDAGSYNAVNASAVAQSVTISGGNSSGVSIIGGKKADSITGTTGNDTLTGGYGADTFVYTGGQDVITDYAANFDKISLTGDGAKYLSHITGVAVDGSDVTLTFSNDANKTLTLKDTLNKKVIVNGATRYFDDNQIIGYDKKTVTLTSAFNGSFDAGSYNAVNASAVAQSVTISGGNSSGVSIIGGKKADSITGTTGNDTLTGGYGADTFVYTGGQDIITDYAANFDKISLAGGSNAKYLSHIKNVAVDANKNVKLTFSNDPNKTLTINGAAGKKVIVNNTTLIFEDGMIYNYNKSKSTVAGGAADVYWFDENNFDAPQLDSIMETPNDYSTVKLDTLDNLARLSKDEFTLTFGDKK